MLIRPARLEDYPAISRLPGSPQELFLAFPTARWPFTVKQVHRLAEQRVDLSVMSDGYRLAGCVDLYDIEIGRWAYVGNLLVAQPMRGKGLARQLLSYMLERIYRLYDIPQARLAVFASNRPALTLYTRLGFSTYASEQRFDAHRRAVTLLYMRRYR